MGLYVLWITVLLIVGRIVVAVKAPQLTSLSIPDDLVKGTEYRLTCIVAIGDPPLAIEWHKNNVRLFSTTNVIISATEHTSTVTFKSLSEGDQGEYRCEAVNMAGKAATQGTLQVNVAPFWIHEPADEDVEEGTTLRIRCSAGGSPAPVFKWNKGTQPLSRGGRYELAEDGSLSVSSAKKIDAGRFVCEASNNIGSSLIKQANIRVFVRPKIKLQKQLVQIELGGTVNITCLASGDHPISIEWRRDGEVLPATAFDKMLISDNSNEQLYSTLVVKNAQASDAGRYVCVAKNTFGEHESEARLVVREPPETPSEVEVSGIWSRGARVAWANPSRVVVSGYEVHYWSQRELTKYNATVHGSSTTTQIPNLHPATEYKIYVVALNDVGPSEQSQTVTFKTKDEEPSGAPLNVHVLSTGPNHAIITWSPPPESEWNSDRLSGYFVGYKAASSDSKRPYSFHTVGPDQSTYTLRGLLKNALYGVVVKAVNDVGYSPPSAETSFYTDDGEYVAAPQLTLKSIDGHSATLRWTVPSSAKISGYTILCRQGEQDNWDETFIANPSHTMYQMTGLMGNEYYQIYMVAHTQFGKSEPSDVLSVRIPDPNGSPQTTEEVGERAEVRQVLYTVVPLICLLLVAVAILSATAVYMYAKKNTPPPPPVNADYDFCFTNIPGAPMLPGMTIKMNQLNSNPYATYSRHTARKKSVNSTPYSTIPRSEKSSENPYAIYESIADVRSLKRRQSLSRQFAPVTMHKVDICDI